MFIITFVLGIITLKEQNKKSPVIKEDQNNIDDNKNEIETENKGNETLENSEIIEENENTDYFENTIIEQPNIDTTNYLSIGIFGISAIFLVLTIILFLMVISVQANSNIKSEITANKKELKAGDKILITLMMDNPKEEKFNCYKATLEYDKNIFEEINQSDFENKNSWEELKYNKNTGEFIAINKTQNQKDKEVVQFTLKVKEEVTEGKTNITIKDIVASEGKKDTEIEQTNIEIDIIKDQIEEPEKPDIITSSKYNIGKDYYITKVLPNTTVNEFKQNVTTEKEMNFIDRNGKVLNEKDIISTGTKLKLDTNIEYTIIVIGDIDGNGKISTTDLAQLKLHCIEKQTLTGNALKAADINFDGNITTTDLAQIKLIMLDKIELK